jgi:hypothetical protein
MVVVQPIQTENETLHRLLEDLHQLKLPASDESVTNNQAKQWNVEGRLITLTNELQKHKLSMQKLRRQFSILRDEKAHFEALCNKLQTELAQLEEALVCQRCSTHTPVNGTGREWREYAQKYINGELMDRQNESDGRKLSWTLTQMNTNSPNFQPSDEEALRSQINGQRQQVPFSNTPLTYPQNTLCQLTDLTREIASLRHENDSYRAEHAGAQDLLKSQERLIRHYESLLQQHGIPTMADALEG